MKSKPPVLQRLNLTWLLIATLVVLVSDPLGIFAGNFSNDSYSQIRSELSMTNNAKVQPIASWDDLFSLEYNNYWRAEMSTEFVERDYVDILNAASLGDEFFNQYLSSKEVTHLLVPKSTEQNGRIFHKFGVRGSIDISLQSPFLTKVADSSGPFGSSLFQVTRQYQTVENLTDANYSLKWSGVRSEFYTKRNTVTEVGMYRYDYNTNYEYGPDVSWFWDQTPKRPGFLELTYVSSESGFEIVNLEIDLVAAYGPNAPTHVVAVTSKGTVSPLTLRAGLTQTVQLTAVSGDSVKISNVTPCRLPSTFEVADMTLNKICFGVTAVRVTPPAQVE